MNTLILYDSVFGNTRKIADAMARAMKPICKVHVCAISEVNLEMLEFISHLVIGSPTRGFRPTKPVSDFISALPDNCLKGVQIATFDTRIDLATIKSSTLRFIVNTGGYAAKPMQKALLKKGGMLSVPPEGFFVSGEEGPLKEGEEERAAVWVQQFHCS